MPSESSIILQSLVSGDDGAARAVFDRYVIRLVSLAKSRLSSSVQARFDPEDIVQSAFRSFFRKIDTKELVLEDSAGLWRLLAAITINKTRKRLEFELALKRNPVREILASELAATSPSPEDALMLGDEVGAFLHGLSDRDRQVVESRLLGMRIETISADVSVSQATVRRILERASTELERRLLADVD